MLTEAVVSALANRREELRSAGRLRSELTPMVAHAQLVPWLQGFDRRKYTRVYRGCVDGVERVIKVYGKDFVRPEFPELIPLLARGLALADDLFLRDTTHLCLPQAFAFDMHADEVLVAFPSLADDARHFATLLTGDKRQLSVLAFAGARGLRALHQAGYVHHDVSPSNLVLGSTGAAESACWIDFDLLGLSGDDPVYAALWHRRVLMGTPAYFPSSWIRGLDDALQSPRTDLISFGYVLADLAFSEPVSRTSSDGPITQIEVREAMRGDVRLRSWARDRGLLGLERVIVTLTDEQADYNADALYDDLVLILGGEGRALRDMAVHRLTWRRRVTPLKRAFKRSAAWIRRVIY